MNSRNVILFGLVASLLLIFSCIFFNAERYYKELGLDTNSKNELASEAPLTEENESQELISALSNSNDTIVETKEEDKVEAISISSEKKEETSSFNYYVENNKTFMSGEIPLLDNGDVFKKIIADCSKSKACENKVTFLDNGETLSWKDLASSTLTIFTNEKVLNPKLIIDKKDIRMEGEFPEENGKEQLSDVVDKYKGIYIITDMTSVKKVIELKPKKEENNETTKEEPNKKETLTKESTDKTPLKDLELEQEKISTLLKNNKITFKRNSGKIRAEGKKVLDEVAKLLKGKENILIDVEGYTDAGGKEKINLWISQARADGVKKYLIKKGINADSITAKGYGESKFLLPKAPYDPSNRRVEIHLKRK
jgi:outer membrane protein OmpA-like peptidoglycan-associated protein